jgi:hypothetical protein
MAMTVEQKKAMRGLIHDLLLSPPVQRIDFDFAFSHGYGYNRHKVDGWGFAHVALLLTTPLGSGRGISVDSRALGPDVGAEYSDADNRLIFPRPVFGSTQYERRDVIHECTHALRDALGAKSRIDGAAAVPLGRTRGVEEEAEAYIAAQLFLINDAATNNWSYKQETDPIFAAADVIAGKLFSGPPGQLVGVGDHAELRKAILADKTYNFMHKSMDFRYSPGANGIRS